jgi:DNA-binding NtrC family response regulator
VACEHGLLGNSPVIIELLKEARIMGATNSKVLITGESGVGKELLARFMHEQSPRSRASMVTINCAGVPESLLESELFGHVRGSFTDAHRDRRGLLEVANGGTVMLDEVGEMSMRMQTVLLRFLENGEIQRVGSDRSDVLVDVRVISATNRNLLEQTQRKEFREDLYYRLNVVHLVVPPLRARREDIGLLFDHYVRTLSELHHLPACELTPEAIARLEQYDWPGNVRELRNVAERLVLRCSGRAVKIGDLPGETAQRKPQPETLSAGRTAADTVAAAYYERITNGRESFWSVVYEPFMSRDVTRATVRDIVSRGLQDTRGNYRLLAQLFNLPSSDYKRFLGFLQKHDCHMPFRNFRVLSASGDRDRLQPARLA